MRFPFRTVKVAERFDIEENFVITSTISTVMSPAEYLLVALKLTVNPGCAVPYRTLKTVVKANHPATFFLTHSQRKFPLRYT